MSAHLPPTAPGANIPGGDHAGPPVLAFGSPDRPPSGTASPTAFGSGSPASFPKSGQIWRRTRFWWPGDGNVPEWNLRPFYGRLWAFTTGSCKRLLLTC